MQSAADLLGWLEGLPLSAFVRESPWAFPTAESCHVLALSLVIGTIAVVDLRLLGVASTNRPVTELCREVLPLTWSAFVLAAIAGALMFVSNAAAYWANSAFRIKFALLALAGINMLAFQFITWRGVARWDRDASTPAAAKFAGIISLCCWVGVVFFGRWIGFTMSPD